jgi:hypothetical protein
MRLNDENIFIFILYYNKKNLSYISFLHILFSLLKEDYDLIRHYYKNLFNLNKIKKHKFLFFIFLNFYFFLFLSSSFLKFLFLKFIFFSLKYIIKYLFFFLIF